MPAAWRGLAQQVRARLAGRALWRSLAWLSVALLLALLLGLASGNFSVRLELCVQKSL